MMVLLSPVRNTVWKIWILSTVPATPWASIQSPMRNGRNSKISTPPAKFARLPCNARPMARPAAPMAATNEVVSTPIIDATLTISRIFRMMFARLLIKPCKARSALRNAIRPPSFCVTLLISHQPMARVITASSTRLPYSMIIGIQVCDTLTRLSTSAFKSIYVLLISGHPAREK
ncbi:hypothetical protein D3C87_1518280 [compost metagenome]